MRGDKNMIKELMKSTDVLYTAIILNENESIKEIPLHMTLSYNKALPKESDLGIEVSLKVIAEGDYFNNNNELENSALLIDKEQFIQDYPQLNYLVSKDKLLYITTKLLNDGEFKNSIKCDFEEIEPYGIKGKLAVFDKEGNYSFKILETVEINEKYLTEVRRSQLLANSKNGEKYKNKNIGR
jgi:hypothetical protein